MQRSLKRKLAAGGIAALAVAGGGGALAATEWSPRAESDAVLADAAEELGVDPEELDDALRQALGNRVDEAVKDGRLTEEQATRLKEALESGDFPVLGLPFRPGFDHERHRMDFRGLDDAASYLGLSEDELRAELEDGGSLADVAKANDKSVDGLVDALVTAANARLDEAVEDGRLSKRHAEKIRAGLPERIEGFVNGDGFRFERRWRGPGGPGPDLDGPAFFSAAA